jgi:hypothetical protein
MQRDASAKSTGRLNVASEFLRNNGLCKQSYAVACLHVPRAWAFSLFIFFAWWSPLIFRLRIFRLCKQPYIAEELDISSFADGGRAKPYCAKGFIMLQIIPPSLDYKKNNMSTDRENAAIWALTILLHWRQHASWRHLPPVAGAI